MMNIQNIENELNSVNFPATKQDIISKLGSKEVEATGGKRMHLRDVINKLPRDRFESRTEVTREIKNLPEFKQSR